MTYIPESEKQMISFDDPIPFAHYSDRRYNHESGWKAHTVWGKQSSNLHYVYDDRLICWLTSGQWNEAKEKADASGVTKNSPHWWQEFLSVAENGPVVMGHVLTGVNRSNGYQYKVFGYTKRDKES